ncbi:Rhodanese-like domain-containing protein [Chytridium lagenaria]|nr:Rhodanese-like domain-containing protein [Chytridium lagenaria]
MPSCMNARVWYDEKLKMLFKSLISTTARASAGLRHTAPAFASSVRLFASTPVSASLFSDYVKGLKESIKEVNVAYVDGVLSKDPVNGPPPTFHLLDVRETYEWNEERIPNASYVGRGCLERDIEQLVPDTFDEVVLYCAGGNRSLIAADSLRRMGYKNVSSLAGGISEWKRSGKKTEHNFNTYSDVVAY